MIKARDILRPRDLNRPRAYERVGEANSMKIAYDKSKNKLRVYLI